jgi:zinc protease
MRREGLAAFAAVTLAACWPGTRLPPAEPNRSVRFGLEISSFTTTNGLNVVVVPDPNAEQVQVSIRYEVGLVDDPPGQEGMAHLVEHLMFQQIVDGETLFARLERSMLFLNGFTNPESTTFVERATPSQLSEMLAIEGLRFRLGCETITSDVFRREREVVINEVREREAFSVIEEVLNEALYPTGHLYRRARATEATLTSITQAQACAFEVGHYAINNATLVVSGNVRSQDLGRALTEQLGLIPARTVLRRAPIPVVAGGQRLSRSLPIDEPLLLFAWPLPRDPVVRARALALFPLLANRIAARVTGGVTTVRWGDDSAPMLAVGITLGPKETAVSALANAERGIRELGAWIETYKVGAARQLATYHMFSQLEDGSNRDFDLASLVAANRAARASIAADFSALRQMTLDDARALARDVLSFEAASSVLLSPDGSVKRGDPPTVSEPIHDGGQLRIEVDPAEANQPEKRSFEPSQLGIQTWQLANGMKIVLLPKSSTPTVDVRLVFSTGTADEPRDQPKLALLAGRGLGENPRDYPWLVDFYLMGGDYSVDVGREHTAFSVRGLDMQLDYLLTALQRLIRNGRYDDLQDAISGIRRKNRTAKPEDKALGEAWSRAMYGAEHPYAHDRNDYSDLEKLSPAAISRFRSQHYAPDQATLIIAGGFDSALAAKWVSFLFDDWTGHAAARATTHAAVEPASIGNADDTSQIRVAIVLPAPWETASRPMALVAAEMLQDVIGDVRHQLGASYGLRAELVEQRRAVHYAVTGNIDAARGAEAMKLIQDRIESLHTTTDAVARSFVAARHRVLAGLSSTTSGSTALANHAQEAVDLERDVRDDVQLAHAVQSLTIADVTKTLAEIDLSRAAIYIRGPRDSVEASFAAIGRTPVFPKSK